MGKQKASGREGKESPLMMAEDINPGHPHFEVLSEYFLGSLPEHRAGRLEEHLAECEECAARARKMFELSSAWTSWTAEAHGAAYWLWRQREALFEAQQHTSGLDLQQRLAAWREQGQGFCEGAVRVLKDANASAVRLVSEGLAALLRPDPLFREFAMANPPARQRGELEQGLSSTAPETLASGETPTPVECFAVGRFLVIFVAKLPPAREHAHMLVMVVPSRGEPKVAELQWQRTVSGKSGWQVAFDIGEMAPAESADFLVVFEPLHH